MMDKRSSTIGITDRKVSDITQLGSDQARMKWTETKDRRTGMSRIVDFGRHYGAPFRPETPPDASAFP